MNPSLKEIQDQAEEVCKIYTNLTSILLQFGYTYMLEHLENKNDFSCIAKTLNILELLETMVDDGVDAPDMFNEAHLRYDTPTTPQRRVNADESMKKIQEKEEKREYLVKMVEQTDQLLKEVHEKFPVQQKLPKPTTSRNAKFAPRRIPQKVINFEKQRIMYQREPIIVTLRLKRNIEKKVQEKLAAKTPEINVHPPKSRNDSSIL